jgi:hypothetical protein
MVQDSPRQTTPGLPVALDVIDRVYMIMVYLTFGMMLRKVAIFFQALIRLMQNDVVR